MKINNIIYSCKNGHVNVHILSGEPCVSVVCTVSRITQSMTEHLSYVEMLDKIT